MTVSDSPIQSAHQQSWKGRLAALLSTVQWPLALGIMLLILSVAAPFWNVPLSRDQGVYATCADTLLRGGVPFRDCWDTKGPILHVTYAVARLIFGRWTAGPYILNTLFIAATSLIVAALARVWFGLHPQWAYGVGMLYGLLAVIIRFDMNAQPESFANFFALLALYFITRRAQIENRWGAWIAGALLNVAVLYKYALAMPFAVAAVALIAFFPINDRRRRWVILAEAIGGAALSTVLFAMYLLMVGALGDALTHVRFIFLYFPKAQLNPNEYAFRSKPIEQTLLYFARLPIIFGLAFIGAGVSIVRRRWFGWPLAAMVLAGIIIVWGQQRFTPYHWTTSLPILSLSIGALINELRQLERLRGTARGIVLGGLSAAALVNTGTFFYQDQWLIMGGVVTGSEAPPSFYERQGVWDHMVAADYIRARTDDDDKIWVWGHHTAIYYLADRSSATRFIYNEPLLMHIRGGHPWQAEWRAEAVEDIYDQPPVYILLTTFDRTFFDFQNPNDSWHDIPEYDNFTRVHYIKEYEFGRFQFFRLKPYWSRHNEPELLDAVTVVDLIEQFPRAVVEAQSDPPIEILPFTMPGEAAIDTIRMHPDARLTYILDLPPGPVCLRIDVGMYPDSWSWGGDGTSFIVEATADGTSNRLWEGYISNAVEDQHWHDQLIDLSAFGGQAIQLSLITGPGPQGNYIGDWAGWALPRIVRPPAGDKCDTNEIVDERHR